MQHLGASGLHVLGVAPAVTEGQKATACVSQSPVPRAPARPHLPVSIFLLHLLCHLL